MEPLKPVPGAFAHPEKCASLVALVRRPAAVERGVPVGILACLMAENSMRGNGYRVTIHIENRHPLNLKSLLALLLEKRNGQSAAVCMQ